MVSPFAANTRVSNGLFSVRGRASDNLAIKEVLYQLNNLGTYRAASTNHGVDWTANVTLQPGPNTFTVESVDFNGRHSVPHVRSIYCVVMRPLTLMTNGEGSIFGATNGQRFEVTRSHRLTARPAPGHLFAGWFGEASGTNLTVDFVMTTSPDFSIQASFVPNPFVPVKGTYAGLFSEADAARHESAGLATMTVTERGTYTARLTGGGRVFGMSGLFADDGAATNVLRRFGTDFLQVEWALDMSGASNNLTAVLRRSDDSWTANLSAERSGFNATTNPVAHQPLRYTMNIPGHDDAAASPGGDGFALIKINPSGVTALAGALADGTPFTQSAPLWRDGRLPLYVPLYGGRGSIHCPLRFTDTETNDVLGLLTWTRPALPLARFYPAGFTNHLALSGSAYTATNRVLSFTNGFVAFRDGNLGAAFTNNVTLSTSNRVVNASTNPLALTITSGSGMFTGTVKPPGSTKVLTFKGALNQKLGLGTGFFLGTNQGGRAFFGER